MAYEKDPNEIGALWMKSGRKGDYMTGLINGESVVLFPVKSTSAKAPQWRVLKSKPKDELAERAPYNANEKEIQLQPDVNMAGAVESDVTDEDIPFAWLLPFIVAAIGGLCA